MVPEVEKIAVDLESAIAHMRHPNRREEIRKLIDNAFRDVHEQGYVAGLKMERKLMRLRLGLAVEGDNA